MARAVSGSARGTALRILYAAEARRKEAREAEAALYACDDCADLRHALSELVEAIEKEIEVTGAPRQHSMAVRAKTINAKRLLGNTP